MRFSVTSVATTALLLAGLGVANPPVSPDHWPAGHHEPYVPTFDILNGRPILKGYRSQPQPLSFQHREFHLEHPEDTPHAPPYANGYSLDGNSLISSGGPGPVSDRLWRTQTTGPHGPRLVLIPGHLRPSNFGSKYPKTKLKPKPPRRAYKAQTL
ncbi:hypothetical protein AX17_003205 [Amanita inopinata Kibby_2008]|nr:hypothetical protein AX17_003205 [Amanita inopinata Kibby_2008]